MTMPENNVNEAVKRGTDAGIILFFWISECLDLSIDIEEVPLSAWNKFSSLSRANGIQSSFYPSFLLLQEQKIRTILSGVCQWNNSRLWYWIAKITLKSARKREVRRRNSLNSCQFQWDDYIASQNCVMIKRNVSWMAIQLREIYDWRCFTHNIS